ncbi:MAG: hypothetical protein ACOWWO_08910 [Peptococcaceae bacterium]
MTLTMILVGTIYVGVVALRTYDFLSSIAEDEMVAEQIQEQTTFNAPCLDC